MIWVHWKRKREKKRKGEEVIVRRGKGNGRWRVGSGSRGLK